MHSSVNSKLRPLSYYYSNAKISSIYYRLSLTFFLSFSLSFRAFLLSFSPLLYLACPTAIPTQPALQPHLLSLPYSYISSLPYVTVDLPYTSALTLLLHRYPSCFITPLLSLLLYYSIIVPLALLLYCYPSCFSLPYIIVNIPYTSLSY